MKLKSSDRIVFHNSKFNKANKPEDITLGRIYTVYEVDSDGDGVIRDDTDCRNVYAMMTAKWTKIVD